MEHYFIFTDESGAYETVKGKKFLEKTPFYIRSNVALLGEDYFLFQKEVQKLNEEYKIPYGEEIKWADLWGIEKGHFRKGFLKNYGKETLQQYIVNFLSIYSKFEKTFIILTITDNTCTNYDKVKLIFMHIQDAYQRVQMEIGSNGFAVFIMDELDHEMQKILKQKGYELVLNGDKYLKYSNVFQSLLFDYSNHCPGLQLADYVAGATNGYVRRYFSHQSGFDFANELYIDVLSDRIRCGASPFGYGIIEIPSDAQFRNELAFMGLYIKVDEIPF